MKQNIDWSLLLRKLEGKFSKADDNKLQQWFKENPNNQSIFNELEQRWQVNKDTKLNDELAFQKIIDNIRFQKIKTYPKSRNWLKTAAIWAFVFCIGGIIGILSLRSQNQGEILITKNTHYGQTAKITLSDGSEVILNARSKISYPENFARNERELQLEGEAYFEVAKDVQRPFIINTGDLSTIVVGTTFNIRAFPEENIEVSVSSGKVKVKKMNSKSSESIDLIKGEKAVYRIQDGSLTETLANTKSEFNWINRTLNFNRITFEEAIQQLQQIYQIDLEIISNAANDCLIRGKYENEKLINVLKGLQLIVNFDYQIKNESTILIDGKGCNN